MTRHTLSPQPHAVERKDKHPANESESHLAGSDKNKPIKAKIKGKNSLKK